MHSQPNNLATISDMDKPLMNDIALTVMEELLRLFNTNEPLWTRADGGGGRDVLSLMLRFIFLHSLTMKPVLVNASSMLWDDGILEVVFRPEVLSFVHCSKGRENYFGNVFGSLT
ncbi:START domain protein [Raphanus sativus]|nr:START domain protein [Raphanus sativus]